MYELTYEDKVSSIVQYISAFTYFYLHFLVGESDPARFTTSQLPLWKMAKCVYEGQCRQSMVVYKLQHATTKKSYVGKT